MKATWPGAVARRVGLSGQIDYTPTRVGLTLHVPCTKGSHVVDVHVDPGLHPDHIAKRMIAKGWTVGSRLVCPEHSQRERRAKTPEKPPMATAAAATKVETHSTVDLSDAAKKAHRFVMMMLEEGYDEAKQAYRESWSDERIHKETGSSLKHVAETREKFFGPLVDPKPAAFLEIEEAVAALNRDLLAAQVEYRRRLDEINSRTVALCRARGWTLPSF